MSPLGLCCPNGSGGSWLSLYLADVNVSASISDLCASITIQQTYINHFGYRNNNNKLASQLSSDESGTDCIYVFPLDEESAVCSFEAEYEGKRVVGRIREKEAARLEYSTAINQGKTAMLLEENARNRFQCRVGRIRAGSVCVIRMTYVTALIQEGRDQRFTLPMSIAQKYIPSGNQWRPAFPVNDSSATAPVPFQLPSTVVVPSVPRVNNDINNAVDFVPNDYYSQTRPQSLSISVAIQTPSPILAITCPSHPNLAQIQSSLTSPGTQSLHSATVKLTSTGNSSCLPYLTQDVIILIDQANAYLPRVTCELDVEKNTAALSLAVIPPPLDLMAASSLACEFIFIIDRSGSMAGGSINRVKEVMQLMLRSLPTRCRFNIYGFGSNWIKLFPACREYDEAALNEAAEHVGKIQADLGGTEIYAPLYDALNENAAATATETSRTSSLPRQIVLLTDGEVGNTQQLIDLTREHVKSSRIFAFGIGNNVDRHLIKSLAAAGKGQAEFISLSNGDQNNDSREIREKVMRQLNRAIQPALTHVEVDWKEFKSEASSVPSEPNVFQQCPRQIGAIFPESRTVIYALNVELPTEFKRELAVGKLMPFQREIVIKAYSNRPQLTDVSSSATSSSVYCSASPSSAIQGNYSISIPITINESHVTAGQVIHRLAAKSRIQELTNYQQVGTSTAADAEILALGLKYQLTTKKTSFVIVYENDKLNPELLIQQELLNGDLLVDNQIQNQSALAPPTLGSFSPQLTKSSAAIASSSSSSSSSLFSSISRPFSFLARASQSLSATPSSPSMPMSMPMYMPCSPSPAPSFDSYSVATAPGGAGAGALSARRGNATKKGAFGISRCSSGKKQDREDGLPTPASAPVAVSRATPAPTLDSSLELHLNKLIQLQSANGEWKLTQGLITAIQPFLKASFHSLERVKQALMKALYFSVQDGVLGTLIALRVLETKFPSSKDDWLMIGMKGRMFVSNVVKNEADWDQKIQKIQKEIDSLLA